MDNLIKENGSLMKSSDLEFSVIYHMPVLAILASFKYKLRYTKEQLVHEPWSLDTYSKIGVTLVLLIMNIVTNGLVCVIDSQSFWLFIISSYLGWQMNLIVAFFLFTSLSICYSYFIYVQECWVIFYSQFYDIHICSLFLFLGRSPSDTRDNPIIESFTRSTPFPLRVSEVQNGIYFAIFSQHATAVVLCLSLPQRS